jgi:lipopolysaccharide/colanic/teichoic acid biosynthesis glycosyltransferase
MPREPRWRRGVDLILATAALTVVGLPLIALGALVKLTSRGPVFYLQERIGLGGVPFRFYKLRTMVQHVGGRQITVQADPRITPVGRLLRKTKLDELPQLLNIIRGDMALIGPRPEVERFVRRYTPEQRRVLDYRPGLASVSQVLFFDEAERLREYADPEDGYVRHFMPRKIAADLHYEMTRTAWSDARLIGRIVWLIVRGRPYGQRLEPDKGMIL